jgi:hypothetical protein
MSGLVVLGKPAAAQSSDQSQTLELAKKSQNPVADLISVPFENDLNFGYGAKDVPEPSSTQYVLNIKPVVPLHLDADWNLITRPIIPVIKEAEAYDNVVKPEDDPTADWTLRLVVSFLFPECSWG